MMILIVAVLAIFTFYSFIFVKHSILRDVLGFLGILLLLGAVVLTTINFHSHWGMKQVTTSTTKEIYSAAPATSPIKMVITQELGNKANNYVLVYRDKPTDKAAKAHFVPDKSDMNKLIHSTANYQVKNVDKATVTTKVTRWRWNSELAKLLFGFADADGTLVKQVGVVTVPKQGWVAMTAQEAKAAAKKAAEMQKEMIAAKEAEAKTAQGE